MSHKEARVISEKYLYNTEEEDWVVKYNTHKEEMRKKGFREVSVKYAPMRVTYQKFTGL
jgi:hypothetical protein